MAEAKCEKMTPSMSFELEAQEKGFHVVAGVDEAGRGPLAGPVVAAAIVLPLGFELAGLNDSKKLSAKKREALFPFLAELPHGIGIASAQEIDSLNILRATHLAMRRAVEALPMQVDFCLIDGLPVPLFPFSSLSIVKGDAKCLSIAAASILAKVTRDRLMLELDALYPEYGFAKHQGYGTKLHLEMLNTYGPIPEHRRSFAPVAQKQFFFN